MAEKNRKEKQGGDQAERRSRVLVCMSLEDKIKLKTMAARSDKTVAKLVHEWLAGQDL